MATFYSHPNCLLRKHLLEVGNKSAEFAKPFNSDKWARLAGHLHDLGKYNDDFQKYLFGKTQARINHSSAGGIYAQEKFGNASGCGPGKILALVIFGHHAGLPDYVNGKGSLTFRLRQREHYDNACKNIAYFPPFVKKAKPPDSPPWQLGPISAELWVRMIFSCLVDADRLHAEKIADPKTAKARRQYLKLAELGEMFDGHMKTFTSAQTPNNKIRSDILDKCRAAAKKKPNLFSLTVPTGGGKTLSSMAFAMRHAALHKKRRIIYAIPYTSIIEQTADIFAGIFGKENVVEHHSALKDEEYGGEDAEHISNIAYKNRLGAQNWDAPIVITTNVQFFESLFAASPGKCRKLHNIADSVVILDEAQMLPTERLAPSLMALRALVKFFGASVVSCTATQPAFNDHGLREIMARDTLCEIHPRPEELFQKMRRVRPNFPKPERLEHRASWTEIAECLRREHSALCIVNSRKDCAELYAGLKQTGRGADECFHLSALMCGEHRSQKIAEIKERLARNKPAVVVSTQLIEAGVDVDFPVVYRALAGLDSIAQAAGRCNRENKRKTGELHVFIPPKSPPPGLLLQGEYVVKDMLRKSPNADFLTPDMFSLYFKKLYARVESFDKDKITERRMQFREIAAAYRLIDEDGKCPVVVAHPDFQTINELRQAKDTQQPRMLRRIRRQIVSVSEKDFCAMKNDGQIMEIPGCAVLTEKGVYREETGLVVPSLGGIINA